MPDDHREKAVEAMLNGYATELQVLEGEAAHRQFVQAQLAAAQPPLQRMFFERFREAMLGSTKVNDAMCCSIHEGATHSTGQAMHDALEVALKTAEELMEGD